MYYYKARWYDAHLGRFSQPDSMVPDPGNPLDWDRYASTLDNNPEKYVDDSGNIPDFDLLSLSEQFSGIGSKVDSYLGWRSALRFVDPIDAVLQECEVQSQCSGEEFDSQVLPVVNSGFYDAAEQ